MVIPSIKQAQVRQLRDTSVDVMGREVERRLNISSHVRKQGPELKSLSKPPKNTLMEAQLKQAGL